VALVVPPHVVLAPTHGVTVAVKPTWVVRLVLHGFELRFAHRVVIAHPRSATQILLSKYNTLQ